MIPVTLEPGGERLSIKLKVDLRDYCVACEPICQAERTKIPLFRAEEKLFFEREHNNLLTNFIELPGALHWSNIKKMLAEQCSPDIRAEEQLALALRDSYGAVRIPYAILCLNNFFIELLKNSIDAMIKQYLSGASANTLLEVGVKLAMRGDDLVVNISDNAGGFNNDYLKEFSGAIAFHTTLGDEGYREKKQDKSYYLGGAGLGMRLLCKMLLEGEQGSESGKQCKLFSVPLGATSIEIKNNLDIGGAEIVLRSPLHPFRQGAEDTSKVHKVAANSVHAFLKPITRVKKVTVSTAADSTWLSPT